MLTIAAEVTQDMVQTLMIGRPSDALDDFKEFAQCVQGIASEVVAVVGTDPADEGVRAIALRCISYGVAGELEYALFPEQQVIGGDTGRGAYLMSRFRELLEDLREMPANAGSIEGVRPTGSFPPPQRYPDPVRTQWARW